MQIKADADFANSTLFYDKKAKHVILTTVLISSRRNLFILNKFFISDKILITCRELYFEVVGHVYLIKMGNLPENACSVSKMMSKMTHADDKNTNNNVQIGAADSFKCKTDLSIDRSIIDRSIDRSIDLSIYLSIYLYVLTPEGDIRRVPGNQVLGVSFFVFC